MTLGFAALMTFLEEKCYYISMAKKKKSQKKHQFKVSNPVTNSAITPVVESNNSSLANNIGVSSAKTFQYEIDNLDLIKSDIRKVLVLAASFAIFQVLLWFLFGHTGVGNSVYHLIKV